MGATESANAALAELVQEVFPEDPDWKSVDLLVQSRMKHLKHYRCKMNIMRLFRIKPSEIVTDYIKRNQELGQPTRLFHGTTPSSAERIIQSGFELPRMSGMFGRGIYFAKDPLKSIRYSRPASRPSQATATDGKQGQDDSTWSVSSRLFDLVASSAPSLFGARPTSEYVRHMLICDVYLGNSRTVRLAKPRFDPDRGLRRSALMRMLGRRRYDSLRAPGGTFGAVRVTEFVIYAEHQAIPRFLIEFNQEQVT